MLNANMHSPVWRQSDSFWLWKYDYSSTDHLVFRCRGWLCNNWHLTRGFGLVKWFSFEFQVTVIDAITFICLNR